MNNNKPKKKTGTRIVLSVICVILALLLLAGTGVTLYVEHLLNKLDRYDPQQEPTLSQAEIDAEQNQTDPDYDPAHGTDDGSDIDWGDDADVQIGGGKDIVNILLIGQDRRPGEKRARSDSMILCTEKQPAPAEPESAFRLHNSFHSREFPSFAYQVCKNIA